MPGRTKRIKTNETRKSNPGKQSSPSITCLPDDCLLLIFQKLNLRNRIVMERVCEKWKEISLKSWSNVEVLSLGYSDEFDDILEMTERNFKSVLWRGRDSITHLYFDDYINNIDPDTFFEIINECCNKLEHLEMTWCFKYREVNVNKISARIAQNLKSLFLVHMYDLKNLPYLLKKAVNLEVVSFSTGHHYTISSLRNLSNKCKSLDIDGCQIENMNHAIELFQKLSNLERLDASSTKIFPEALLPVSHQLVTLILSGDTSSFFKGKSYKNLIMPNLKNLSVKHNSSITDEVVSAFHKCFPSLENAFFEGCDNIKFTPSCCLEKCENIKLLDISETDITDEGFTYLATQMANLESLKCLYTNVTEAGFTKAVTSLPNLNHISVGSVDDFTDKFFEAALKSAESRTQDKPLEIVVEISLATKDDVLSRCKLKKEEKDAPPKSKNLKIVSGWQRFYVDKGEE